MSRRALAFVVLSTGMLMMILDGNIVTVALPSIQADLGFGQPGLAWVVNAYLIPVAGLLLLAGRLGDLVGRKRVFLAGLSVFTAASLAAGVASDRAVLVGARFAQGLGGALVSAVVLGMIVTLFPQPREQARAIAIFSFMGAAGASIGTIGGGLLTQLLSWHWIFLVNVPIGVVVIVVAVRVIRADQGLGLRAGADAVGAILGTAALTLGVYSIVSTHSPLLGVLAVALLTGFVVRQARVARPLLPLRVFASRAVSGANAVQMLMVAAAMGGFQFLTTLYLRQVLGFSALTTGLAFLPTPVVIGAVSLAVSTRVVARFGGKPVLVAGLVLIGAGLALLTGIPAQHGYWLPVLPAMVVFGVGAGLALPAVTGLAMSGVAAADAGVAGGLANTTQQLGGALGIAGFAAIAGTHTTPAALTSGYQLAYAAGVGVLAAAILVAAIVLPGKRKARISAREPVGIS